MSSDLPGGWREAQLGDVARIVTGKTPSTKEPRYWGGDIPFVTPSDITDSPWLRHVERHVSGDGMKYSSVVPAGSVLFTCIASIGKSCITHEVSTFNQQINACVPSEQVDAYFLYNALQVRVGDMLDLAGTTAVPIINKTTFSKVSVKLPHLDEQQRIAEVLRSVDEAIAGAEAALDAGREVHRLLLEALFGVCFADQPLDAASVVTIKQVCERVTYGFTNPMPTTEEGPWMLTAANVREGWIDYNSARHTSTEAYSNDISEKSRPPLGAVLVTKDGTLGRVARVDRADVCINQSVAVLIPNSEVIDSGFLSFLLQCSTGQDRMLADSGGSSVKHIYISKLADMPFALPPRALQQERAAVAEESERSFCEQASAVQGLLSLKAALASDLLSGRVRVPA